MIFTITYKTIGMKLSFKNHVNIEYKSIHYINTDNILKIILKH